MAKTKQNEEGKEDSVLDKSLSLNDESPAHVITEENTSTFNSKKSMTIRKSGRASKLESDTDSEESELDEGGDDDVAEDEDDEDEEDNDQEDDEESDSQLNLKSIFKYLLPSFLFKWNGEIELEPDMADVKNYC